MSGKLLADQPDADRPDLIGLERLKFPSAFGGMFGLGLMGIAFLAVSGGNQTGTTSIDQTEDRRANAGRTISVDVEDVRGFMTSLPSDIAVRNDNAVASLLIAEDQKDEVRSKLEQGRLRMGSITVWDNQAEDGDEIQISAAGIQQTVPITHAPQTFLVPHVPGGTVRITGTRDGQGGVTLGIRTLLGPVYLPTLEVGEAIELPVQ